MAHKEEIKSSSEVIYVTEIKVTNSIFKLSQDQEYKNDTKMIFMYHMYVSPMTSCRAVLPALLYHIILCNMIINVSDIDYS